MSTYRLTVYEYNRDGETYIGTRDELSEITGVAKGNLYLYTVKIGTRHMKLKAVHKKTGEVHYGTLSDLAKKTKLKSSTIREAVTQREGNMLNYTVTPTGQHIIELSNGQRKTTGKPEAPEAPEAHNVVDKTVQKRQPVTPMSKYWKDMFEWSTRHLRRDA